MSRVSMFNAQPIAPGMEAPMEALMPSATVSRTGMAPEHIRLRRSGLRPREFHGVLLCSTMSYEPGSPFWYELNIYRTMDEGFVVGISFFTKDEKGRDFFSTYDAMNIEGIVQILETYDPSRDIDADALAVDREHTSAAELMLYAVTLKLKIEEARRQYSDLVGQVLYELNAA